MVACKMITKHPHIEQLPRIRESQETHIRSLRELTQVTVEFHVAPSQCSALVPIVHGLDLRILFFTGHFQLKRPAPLTRLSTCDTETDDKQIINEYKSKRKSENKRIKKVATKRRSFTKRVINKACWWFRVKCLNFILLSDDG